jgi:excisionase family DNA binding protein
MVAESKHAQPSSEDFLPIGEAARLFGVSVETLRRWDRQGRIKSIRTLGGQRRFARTEVERVKAEAAA